MFVQAEEEASADPTVSEESNGDLLQGLFGYGRNFYCGSSFLESLFSGFLWKLLQKWMRNLPFPVSKTALAL